MNTGSTQVILLSRYNFPSCSFPKSGWVLLPLDQQNMTEWTLASPLLEDQQLPTLIISCSRTLRVPREGKAPNQTPFELPCKQQIWKQRPLNLKPPRDPSCHQGKSHDPDPISAQVTDHKVTLDC